MYDDEIVEYVLDKIMYHATQLEQLIKQFYLPFFVVQ